MQLGHSSVTLERHTSAMRESPDGLIAILSSRREVFMTNQEPLVQQFQRSLEQEPPNLPPKFELRESRQRYGDPLRRPSPRT
jgi:hypothetical protein